MYALVRYDNRKYYVLIKRKNILFKNEKCMKNKSCKYKAYLILYNCTYIL